MIENIEGEDSGWKNRLSNLATPLDQSSMEVEGSTDHASDDAESSNAADAGSEKLESANKSSEPGDDSSQSSEALSRGRCTPLPPEAHAKIAIEGDPRGRTITFDLELSGESERVRVGNLMADILNAQPALQLFGERIPKSMLRRLFTTGKQPNLGDLIAMLKTEEFPAPPYGQLKGMWENLPAYIRSNAFFGKSTEKVRAGVGETFGGSVALDNGKAQLPLSSSQDVGDACDERLSPPELDMYGETPEPQILKRRRLNPIPESQPSQALRLGGTASQLATQVRIGARQN